MLSRRDFVIASMVAFAIREAIAADCHPELLKQAIAKAGGEKLLRSVKELRWHGTAKIFAGDRVIEIGASTAVKPFVSARSDTWLLSDGPEKKRSLLLDGGQGWMERNGQRTPMPEAMRIHEQQQYAFYGLMLLVEVCAHVVVSTQPAMLRGLRGVEVEHEGAPRTAFYFEKEHRLVAATNRVNDPEDSSKPPIEQRFSFDGEIVDRGVRWPRTLKIFQREAPYFELTLNEFVAERQ